MVRLFWTQNENPKIPNTLINNEGEILNLDNEESEGYELFNELLNYQETSISIYKSKNLSIKRYAEGGYFISSNFAEKDDLDRRMGFMFFTQNTEKDTIINDLLFFSSLIHRHLTKKDEKNIDNELRKDINKKKRIIIRLITIAIAIVTIYVLWKKIT